MSAFSWLIAHTIGRKVEMGGKKQAFRNYEEILADPKRKVYVYDPKTGSAENAVEVLQFGPRPAFDWTALMAAGRDTTVDVESFLPAEPLRAYRALTEPRQGGKVTSMVERLTEENQRLHQAFWGMAEQLDNWARQNQVKADDLHGNVSRHQYSALATEQRNYASWIRRILRGKG